jgi:hypothetical protein
MMNEHNNLHKRPSRFGDISRSAKHVGRIIAFLTREQVDFIDKIGKDALFSTGKKLSRTEIIQAMVEIMRKLNPSGQDVHSIEELERKILELSKKNLMNIADELKKEGGKNENR